MGTRSRRGPFVALLVSYGCCSCIINVTHAFSSPSHHLALTERRVNRQGAHIGASSSKRWRSCNNGRRRGSGRGWMMMDSKFDQAETHTRVWESRRSIISGLISTATKLRGVRSLFPSKENDPAADSKTAVVVTAASVAVAATLLRYGGRTALVQLVGLDVVADAGVTKQIGEFLEYVNGLGDLKALYFLLCWAATKTLMFDFGALVLALSSGLLFGGVLQGAFACAVCAAVGSSVGFWLARTGLSKSVEEQIAKRPALKAVERAVAKEGIKTVIVLRLSPVLPIPIGAYSYVYGSTALPFSDFFLGTFLGSIKPYILDAYLGIVGGSVVSPSALPEGAGSGPNDVVLLLTFAAVVLVGTFATQLANATWEEVTKEMQEDERDAGAAAGAGAAGQEGQEEGLGKGWDWKALWGVKAEALPNWLNEWERRAAKARESFNTVIAQEALRSSQKQADPSFVLPVLPPPCPPPLADGGAVDWGQYLTESFVLSGVIWDVLAKYSEPQRGEPKTATEQD